MQTWLINERYRLWRQVSEGPHGRVYLAEDKRRPIPCALKIWHPPVSGSLRRDAVPTYLSALEHPHLAPLLDFGRLAAIRSEEAVSPPGPDWQPALERGEPAATPEGGEGPLFFVTPWYGGGDLFTRCDALLADQPTEETISRWLDGLAAQLLSALRFLHEHSLLHFDVSPRNILFTTGEVAPGIPGAVLIDLELSDRDSTPLGTRVRGTVPYIAPEVLKESMVDPRADLYSLGASLYHALDRAALIGEHGPDGARALAEDGRLPDLRKSIPEFPSVWSERLGRLLSPDPADRPGSAAEVLEEICRGDGFPPQLNSEEPISWQPLRPVGLEKEFDYLHREIEKLRLGESGNTLVLVGGETGIGRQAVAHRLRDRARLEGLHAVHVTCGGIVEPPLEPLARLLEEIRRDPLISGPDPRELADLVHSLRVDSRGNEAMLPSLPTVEEERARRFGRVGTVLERLGAEYGVLFIIEDLHRASPELLEILGIVSHRLHSQRDPAPEEGFEEGPREHSVARAPAPRILFLCTYDDQRRGEEGAGLDALASQSHVARITLKPLTRTRARQVVQSTLGRCHLPAQVVDTLHTLANGLTRPLLALLRESHRQGLLRQERPGWVWVGDPDAAASLPLLRAEAHARLSEEDRLLLSLTDFVAGPIGRTVLIIAAQELGIGGPEERLVELQESGWLGVVSIADDRKGLRLELPLPDGGTRSDPPLRARLARALGRALLLRHPDDPTGPAAIFEAGGDWHSLAGVLPRALENLSSRFHLASLVRLVDRVEAHAPPEILPSDAHSLRVEALRDLGREEEALEHADRAIGRARAEGEVALEWLRLRGELLRRLGRLPAARQQLEEAIDLISPDTSSPLRVHLHTELSQVLRGEGVGDRAHAEALLAVEAVTEAESGTSSDPVLDFEARLELARAQLAQGWNERAAEWLEAFRESRGEELPIATLAHLHNVIAEIEYGRGRFDIALSHWRRSLPLERRIANYASLATVVISLGRVAYARGNHRRATRLHRLSLRLREQIGDRRGVARALNNIGLLYKMQNKVEAAEACFRRCLGILEELGPPDDVAALLGNLSDIMVLKGSFPLALKYSLQSLDIRKPSGNRRGIAFAYYRIANIYRNQGELDRAADFAAKSLELRRELGDRHNLVYSQKLLGDLQTARARYYEANRSLRQSLSLADTLGNRAGRCTILTSIALLEVRMGRLDASVRHAEEGLAIASSEELELYVGLARLALGIARLEQGDLSAAEEQLVAAEEIFRRERSRRELAQVLLVQTELALELGSVERGWPLLEESYATIEELGLIDLQPTYYRLRGGLAASGPRPDPAIARRLLERGLEEAQDLDLPEEIWRLHRDLAQLEERDGEQDAASTQLRQAAEQLQTIHDGLPAEFQGSYLASGARLELLTEWRSREQEPLAVRPGEGRAKGNAEGVSPEAADLLRLQEVTLLLNSEWSLQVLLDRILDEVLELFGAERGFLILLEGGEEQIRVARDIEREEVESPEFKYSHSIAREVVETGRIFLTNDAQKDRRLRDSHSVHDLKLQAIACFPLVWREEMLGVIYIENRFRKQIVPRERMRLLEAFSAQTAQAIANARLHDQLVRRTDELEVSTQEIADLNDRLRDRVKEQDRELAVARRAIAEQQEQLEERYRFHNMIGSSEEMQEVFRLLDRIAGTDLPVLVEGESGTGKELAARAIHYNSERRRAPFVSENCGALSENLLESELFGHVKGAFTGADRDHPGLFASAEGGTLFLDEVHQLSLGSQRKLLRVLQEGEVRPVGGEDVIHTDVRVLAASNEPLYGLVQAGRFREDLYYRLNVLRVELPPLRNRGNDILILAQHFLDQVVESQHLGPKEFSIEALRELARYPFPGNVRELRNIVEKGAILGDVPIIGVSDLFFDTTDGSGADPIDLPEAFTEIPLKDAQEEFQRRYLERILSAAEGVVSHAAARSGITRESFHRLMRKYGIQRPRNDP